MEQELSVSQPSTYPPSLSRQQSANGPVPSSAVGVDFGQVMMMFQNGLPSIDKIPVEDTHCPTCQERSPRIHVLSFSAVVCPNCKRVYVDER